MVLCSRLSQLRRSASFTSRYWGLPAVPYRGSPAVPLSTPPRGHNLPDLDTTCGFSSIQLPRHMSGQRRLSIDPSAVRSALYSRPASFSALVIIRHHCSVHSQDSDNLTWRGSLLDQHDTKPNFFSTTRPGVSFLWALHCQFHQVHTMFNTAHLAG